jgi:hypothetical protein
MQRRNAQLPSSATPAACCLAAAASACCGDAVERSRRARTHCEHSLMMALPAQQGESRMERCAPQRARASACARALEVKRAVGCALHLHYLQPTG